LISFTPHPDPPPKGKGEKEFPNRH
jgi:hypothetical protein